MYNRYIKSSKEGICNMKEVRRYKRKQLNHYRKVRGRYKEIETIEMKVQIGDIFQLQGNAIHEWYFEKDMKEGHYILQITYHKMGKGQLKRSEWATYQVEEQAPGKPKLIRLSNEENKEEMRY